MNAPAPASAIPVATQAGVASTERGIVMLDGPNGVAISMTSECAERTGRALIAAAEEARLYEPAP